MSEIDISLLRAARDALDADLTGTGVLDHDGKVLLRGKIARYLSAAPSPATPEAEGLIKQLDKLSVSWLERAKRIENYSGQGATQICAEELAQLLTRFLRQSVASPPAAQSGPGIIEAQAFHDSFRAAAKEQKPDPKVWLVWSNEHNAWWKADACGYVTVIEAAGRYTYAEACRHAGKRSRSEADLPDEIVTPAPEFVASPIPALGEGPYEPPVDIKIAPGWMPTITPVRIGGLYDIYRISVAPGETK